ncbi:MAG: hypothetical protein ACLUPK_03085 [Veillonella sp.]
MVLVQTVLHSNNNADMLEEARLAATLHKARLYDPKAIPAQAAWNMGTVEGASSSWIYMISV